MMLDEGLYMKVKAAQPQDEHGRLEGKKE